MHGFLDHPGWYWMFIIEGILAVIAGIVTFIYLDDNISNARFLNENEKQALQEKLSSEESVKTTSKIIDAISNVTVWHLAIIYMIIQISVYGLIFFLPTQVAQLMGTTVGFKASLVAAIPWIAALFGTYFIPRYSDKVGERRNIAAITLLVAGLGIGISALASPSIAIIALCFAAIGFIAVQPVFWTIPTNLLSGAALAAGIGFINMFGAFGGFLAPIIRVKAETLFNNNIAGLLTLALITIIGTITIFMLKQTNKNS